MVSLDRIIDDLWDEPPETAHKTIQVYVSRLRRLLPEGVLKTRAPGYELRVEPEAVDLDRFERLRSRGRAELQERRYAQAAQTLREALEFWRGAPLAEFGGAPFAEVEGPRLEELQTSALEDRLESDLELGRATDVVPEIEALVVRHPLRERLRRQLILALYRAGRQAEALAAYRAYREALVDLGLEPSPPLKELERRVLQQDPTLDVPTGPPPADLAQPSLPPSLRPQPEIQHARSGDVSIAYQVVGDGPRDLILAHGWICSFQPGWEYPRIERFYRRLAAMGRLILFDKRGTGLSDRVSLERLPDLETRMDDVRAVLDAAASERAVVLGISEGVPMSLLFASTYPERTVALGLISGFARRLWAPDYPIGEPEELVNRRMAVPEQGDWAYGTAREWLSRVAPSVRDEATLRWYASYVARGASPGAIRALRLMNNQIDVRHVLPAIHVPTLVVHRKSEAQPYRDGSRWMADHISGAKLVELAGEDHLPWEGDEDTLLDALESFVGGLEEQVEPDRVLVTLLVTDIVGSTAHAAQVGDRAWGDLVERHFALVRAQLGRFRGAEIDSAGDGILAVFDGPARAVRCAAAIVDSVASLGLSIRAGVHTGEVERSGDRVRGIAVHVAARVAAAAAPDEVLVSQTVKDLVAGSGLEFVDRGSHQLAGVPGAWELHAPTASSVMPAS
jgi:class 3 adenylate cyclase/DNA-binding SARP family transcriptional activator